jgi:hypothetical protein
MRKRNEFYLANKFWPLYKDKSTPIYERVESWGFEIGDGWFHIIQVLSEQLCSGWLTASKRYKKLKSEEGQETNGEMTTKEMVEAARMKMEEEAFKVPTVLQVKEKYGGLRFYVDTATEQQRHYIEFAEALSLRTCEICGRPGKPNKTGWIKTRCSTHRHDPQTAKSKSRMRLAADREFLNKIEAISGVNRCAHYNGTKNDCCKAGVPYASFKKLPCLTVSDACGHKAKLTQEDLMKERENFEFIFKKFIAECEETVRDEKSLTRGDSGEAPE